MGMLFDKHRESKTRDLMVSAYVWILYGYLRDSFIEESTEDLLVAVSYRAILYLNLFVIGLR
jgi:hypothetical protein